MGSRTERVHGTLTAWDDDRGFGFITPAQGTGKTFVHIKAFPAGHTRPQLGEALTFDIEQSADGKRRAARVHPAGKRMLSSSGRTPARRTSRAARYLPILFFVAGYLVVNTLWPIPVWVAGLYLAASIVCFSFYAVDKSAATAGRWRVSETTLLLWGVIGGWPGAIVAQQTLRHKTQKASFRSAFRGSVIVNLIVFLVFATPAFALFVEWTRRPLF
ncbi:DNA-binding protein [Cryobacterium sp. LW097]|uniref:DUF1294 domain-containing protein n=1 Tax=Cryobacterium sp. LW097 TaxID=1978566 RepID=UPI000B4CF550|nr:cold shock and DUF1294 domain-containing protein [Cryobacterium sp. LW097]ASD22807.1 DNA-binding protein [Cryobacterium sp. LW097]